MRFLASIVAFCAALAIVEAVPLWPAATDELEDIMFLLTGHSSRGFSSAVSPCSFSSAGPGRQGAAEWLRTAFHDMATGNVFLHTGGLDASLMFELNSGENVGAAFNTTLTFMSGFFNSRVSVADLIALGVYMAVRSCGGPVVQIRAGRIDATAAGSLGVPLPQNSVGTFQNQFLRTGFNTEEMIAMVACGHTIGGVHAGNFPDIVPVGSAPNDFQHMDSTFDVFDERIATDYVTGPSIDPMVVGPSRANGRNSDARIFAADANVTITAMTDSAVFRSTCASILQRMIEVVPPGVTLSDPMVPYEVKPSGLQLTLVSAGSAIQFVGEIRVRTTVTPASSIASVQLIYKDRDGGNTCGACTINTAVAGTASGFDDSFAFYAFLTNLSPTSSISSFNILVTLTSGATQLYDNNGVGFRVQDSIMLQSTESCFNPTIDAGGNQTLTVVAAVRSSISGNSVSLGLTKKVGRLPIPVPALQTVSVPMTQQQSVGLYNIYSASYLIPASQSSGAKFEVSTTTDTGKVADSFKNVADLPSTCGSPVSSSSSSSSLSSTTTVSSSTTTSSSSSATASQTGPAIKPTIGSYVFRGCYTEGNGVRALTGAVTYAYQTMTLEMCAASCAGFTYWGVEYGGECYCGNTLADSSVLAANQADCNFLCPGNSLEYCGAGNRLELYILSSASSSTASTSSSVPISSTTTASTTTSATPTGPSIKPSVGPYTYYGCQTEATNMRALSQKATAYDTMTLESCQADCAGYAYFGTEYGRECYCGNSFNTGSVSAPNSECSFLCAGNPLEFCGAGNRLSVYALSGSSSSASSSTPPSSLSSSTSTSATPSSVSPTPTGPTIVPSAGSYTYYGCFTEATNTRALSAAFSPSDTQTIKACVAACAGYTYAGAEYGRECWCGNSFAAGSVLTSNSDCSMTCSGNAFEYCGGGNRLSVYKLNGVGGSASSSSPPSSTTVSMITISTTTTSTTSTSATPSPTIVPSAGPYNYLGCYTEGAGGRALSAAFYPNDTLTIETCASLCSPYLYFGAEYSRECWCGDSFGPGVVPAPNGNAECSMTCAGSGWEYCGAGNRLSVYVRNGTV